MFKLPNSIIRHIYSFDSTFHLIYKNLLDEFNYVNNFWRLHFNNQSLEKAYLLTIVEQLTNRLKI